MGRSARHAKGIPLYGSLPLHGGERAGGSASRRRWVVALCGSAAALLACCSLYVVGGAGKEIWGSGGGTVALFGWNGNDAGQSSRLDGREPGAAPGSVGSGKVLSRGFLVGDPGWEPGPDYYGTASYDNADLHPSLIGSYFDPYTGPKACPTCSSFESVFLMSATPRCDNSVQNKHIRNILHLKEWWKIPEFGAALYQENHWIGAQMAHFVVTNPKAVVLVPPCFFPKLSRAELKLLNNAVYNSGTSLLLVGGLQAANFMSANLGGEDGFGYVDSGGTDPNIWSEQFTMNAVWSDGPFAMQNAASTTLFQYGPPSLEGLPSTVGIRARDLPPGTKHYYMSSDEVSVVFEVPAGEGRILFVGYDYADMAPHWIDTLLLAERELEGDTEVQSLSNATSGVPQQQPACTSNGCNSDKEIRKVFVAGSKPRNFLGTSADIIGKAIGKIKTMPARPPPPVISPPPVDEDVRTDEGEEEQEEEEGTGQQSEESIEHEFDHTGDGTQDVDGGFEYSTHVHGSGSGTKGGYGYGSGDVHGDASGFEYATHGKGSGLQGDSAPQETGFETGKSHFSSHGKGSGIQGDSVPQETGFETGESHSSTGGSGYGSGAKGGYGYGSGGVHGDASGFEYATRGKGSGSGYEYNSSPRGTYHVDGDDGMDGDDFEYAIDGHEYGSGPSFEHTTHTSHEYFIDGSGYGSGPLSHEYAVDGHEYAIDGHEYGSGPSFEHTTHTSHEYVIDGSGYGSGPLSHEYAVDGHEYAIDGHEYGSGPSFEHTTHTSHEYVTDGSGPSFEYTTHEKGYGYGSESKGLSTKERAGGGRLARLSVQKGGSASQGGRRSSWNDDSWASISKWLAKKEKGVLPRGAGVGERGGFETLRAVHKEKLEPQQAQRNVQADSGGKPGEIKTGAVADHGEEIESAIRKAMAELAKQRCPPGNNFKQCGPETRKFGPEGEEPPVRAPGFKSAGGQQLASSGAGGGRRGRGWTSLRISDAIKSLSLSDFDLGSAK